MRCMWNKPREFSKGAFSGNGYEISAWSGGRMTPTGALNQWKGSSGHDDVIMNRGIWTTNWAKIGASIDGGHASAWFAK